jgi:hypothetical protein
LISLAAFLISYLSLTLQSPHGTWDGWAIWNMKAKFLNSGGEQWQGMFSPSLKTRHPDYPLLLPSIIATFWQYIGKESIVVPQIVGLIFALGLATFLFAGLSVLRGRKQASIGTSILVATPFFVQNAASQYADIPLTFYIVGTLVFLSLAFQSSTNRNFQLLIAGLLCGFAAWTKNEGIMFVLCVGLAWCVYSSRKRTIFSAETAMLVLGILPGLIVSILFKFYVNKVQSFTHVSTSSEIFARLTDISRYVTVGLTFGYEILKVGGWFYGFPILILAYLWAVGWKRPEYEILILIILSLMLGGYVLVYMTTPQPLVWHLSTSLNRILFHLWPGALFLTFLIARTPEERKLSYVESHPAMS